MTVSSLFLSSSFREHLNSSSPRLGVPVFHILGLPEHLNSCSPRLGVRIFYALGSLSIHNIVCDFVSLWFKNFLENLLRSRVYFWFIGLFLLLLLHLLYRFASQASQLALIDAISDGRVANDDQVDNDHTHDGNDDQPAIFVPCLSIRYILCESHKNVRAQSRDYLIEEFDKVCQF